MCAPNAVVNFRCSGRSQRSTHGGHGSQGQKVCHSVRSNERHGLPMFSIRAKYYVAFSFVNSAINVIWQALLVLASNSPMQFRATLQCHTAVASYLLMRECSLRSVFAGAAHGTCAAVQSHRSDQAAAPTRQRSAGQTVAAGRDDCSGEGEGGERDKEQLPQTVCCLRSEGQANR